MRSTSSREDCRQGNCLKPVELEQGTPMRRALVRTKAIEFQDGASSRGTRTPIMVYARPAGYYATSGRESANGPSGTAEAKTAKSNRIPQSRTLPQCVQDSTLDSRSPSPLSLLRKTRQDPFDSPPIHASPSGARTDRPSRRRFANFLLLVRYRPRSSSHSQLVSRYYISYIIQRTRPTSMPLQRGSNPSCTTSRLRGDGGDAGTNPES
jgi:hypothetical protein